MKVILATSSPYRKEAFRLLNIDFISKDSGVEEYFEGRPKKPKELVKELSRLKAEAVAKDNSSGIVVGFDSVGYFRGKILEKPKSKEEECYRLKQLSAKRFEFYTGIFMMNLESEKKLSKAVATEVLMRKLEDSEINKYLEEDSKFNTYALGFDPLLHYSSTFIKRIKGSYNNLIRGIPLEEVMDMLFEIGYKI